MILKRINKLNDVGIFQDFEWPNPNGFQDFKKYNVIYGWNGTGKSTLSRLLQSLEEDTNLFEEFQDSEFKILFEDGESNQNVITEDNIENSPAIRVFNEKFIENHIRWNNIQADSIAYVGEENVERKEQLISLKGEKKDLNKSKSRLESKKGDVSKAIMEWKKQHARMIKDALTTKGRSDKYANYDRGNLKKELHNIFKEREKDYSYLIKSEEKLTKIRTAIHQSKKKKVSEIELKFSDLGELYQSLRDILDKTVVSKAIDELKEKPNIERWVRNGFKLHQEKELDVCQFCKQKIPKNRLAELEGHFSNTYDDFLSEVQQLKNRIKNAVLKLEYPNEYELDKSLQEKYKRSIEKYEKIKKVFDDNQKRLLEGIERKQDSLHRSLDTRISINENLKNEVKEVAEEINQIIKDHNLIVENFEDEILKKKREWELSHITSNIDELIKLEGKDESHQRELGKLTKKSGEVNKKIDQLKKDLSDNEKAAGTLNKYLNQYLGRNDIQVDFDEESGGFHFKRGEDDATNLSKGERTGIALIYFLTKLGERDFNIQDCIVVIDDPVSSLDASSLFYAFSFIKEHCKKAKQLILLTHNFELLRQINKWLYYESKESRFMIKCDKDKDGRKSYLDKIDPLLTDFESEYHYLFKLLYNQNEAKEDSYISAYNYPNIARRYLEMFFSFRAPGKSSMHKKINKAVQKEAITKEEGTALRHFLNVYSHGDNNASFVRFDITHLEKANDAIRSTLKLVKKYDPNHYQDMVSLINQNG